MVVRCGIRKTQANITSHVGGWDDEGEGEGEGEGEDEGDV